MAKKGGFGSLLTGADTIRGNDSPKEETTKLNCNLPISLKERMMLYRAKNLDESFTDIVIQGIVLYLDSKEKK